MEQVGWGVHKEIGGGVRERLLVGILIQLRSFQVSTSSLSTIAYIRTSVDTYTCTETERRNVNEIGNKPERQSYEAS